MQGLKVLVILMGFAIFAMIGLIIMTVVGRIGDGPDDKAAGFGTVTLPTAATCELAGAEIAEGERLVLRFAGPAAEGCRQLVILDLESGRELGRVQLTPGP